MRLIIAIALLLSFPALADITGPVRVINADTLDLGGKRIRLYGIDALEAKQTCWLKATPWQCGADATAALKKLIGGAEIRCAERRVDRYKQTLAVCYLGKINLSAWLGHHLSATFGPLQQAGRRRPRRRRRHVENPIRHALGVAAAASMRIVGNVRARWFERRKSVQ
jgi:hypothetical protein